MHILLLCLVHVKSMMLIMMNKLINRMQCSFC